MNIFKDIEHAGSECSTILFAYGNMIRYDPILVHLTSMSNCFVLCTNMNIIYIIIVGGA